MRNVLVRAHNARDSSLLEQPGIPNGEPIAETLETMNERWPRMMMTRGDLAGQPVSVVWVPDRRERYRQVAHIEVVAESDGFELTLVDGASPELVAEEPPGRTVAEWESEAELDRGEGRWV